jgi:hypothetical protein
MNRLLSTSCIFFLTLIAFWSCEKTSDTSVNPDYTSPLLLDVSLDRSAINLDTDTAAAFPAGNNQYNVTLTATVRALKLGSSGPYSVTMSVIKPGASEPSKRINGTLQSVGSDTLRGEVPISFQLLRSDIGNLILRVAIQSASGLNSNEFAQSLFITRRNSRPIITAITLPDSVTVGKLQSPDSTFPVSAAVSDSDGVSDIDPIGGIMFLSLKPDSTYANGGRPIPLFDDGGDLLLFLPNGRSGDAVKGDGVFTNKVLLLSAAQRGKFIFKFFAIDNSGVSSDTIDKPIFVK